MSKGILVLNDQNILLFTSEGEVVSEPGFAALSQHGITTGQQARNSAWLEPQNNHCNYWYQINQRPIKPTQKWARHNADIAYAQLKSMFAKASGTRQLMLFVPGHFSDEQTALIAAIIKAHSIDVISITNSALLLGARDDSEHIVVEITLHQAIVSSVRCSNANTKWFSQVLHQQVIPDTGTNQIHNTLARYISDKFIQQHRYDPLHNSNGEQALHNNLNKWINALGQRQKLLVTVDSDGGELSISLQRDEIIQLLTQRLSALKTALAQTAANNIILSGDANFLADYLPMFVFEDVSRSNLALIDEIFTQPSHWDAPSTSLIRNQSLTRDISDSDIASFNHVEQSLPTHILLDGQAWPISEKLSIHYHNNRYVLQPDHHTAALAFLELKDDKLLVKEATNDPNKNIHLELIVGQTLNVGNINLQLIEVIDG